MPVDDEYIDLHDTLLSYREVFETLIRIESEGGMRAYCKGANEGGRWFFQFYSEEFIYELVRCITTTLYASDDDGPVLEVMSGDGRLTELLRTTIARDVIATDSKDGRYNIAYPKWVEKLDAIEAVKKYSPAFVVLSWEPYLSTVSQDLVETGLPLAWIGEPGKCGHIDLFNKPHQKIDSRYTLGKFDSLKSGDFKTDIFLFNTELI